MARVQVKERMAARFVETVKGAGRYEDGRGLALIVTEAGSKRWTQRIVIRGKRCDLGLGGYPAVSLEAARRTAQANVTTARAGDDPREVRRKVEEARRQADEAAKARPTFMQVAEEAIAAKGPAFRNAKHLAQWGATLRTYAAPMFGQKPVDEVDRQDVLRALAPIWTSKPETASRVRGRIEAVLDYAKATGLRGGDNPAVWRGGLASVLPAPRKVRAVEHHPAVALDDAPGWFAELRRREGMGARCLEFLALTLLRSGEVRGARWDEIDLERALWTVPGPRMKAKKLHRVPLSAEAVALLEALPRFEGNPLVFPAVRGGMLSDMTLSAVMKRMHADKAENDAQAARTAGRMLAEGEGGYRDPLTKRPSVPHGLRSTFSDWRGERTTFPNEMGEVALAHKIGNAVEAAYRRGDQLEKRRAMMTAWAGFLTGAEGRVVAFPSAFA